MNWQPNIDRKILNLPAEGRYTPFNGEGGLGKFFKIFGDKTEEVIKELNEELAT